MKLLVFMVFCVAFLFPQFLEAQKISEEYKSVDYCSLFDASQKLEGKTIKSQAFMTYSTVLRVDGADSFLYSTNCNGGDNFSTIDFSVAKNLKKLENTIKTLKNEKNYILEIEFIGKIETSIIPSFGHLGWARAEIQLFDVISVKVIKSTSNIEKPNSGLETPLRNKGRLLKEINAQFMVLLFSRKDSSLNLESFLENNYTINTQEGRKFSKYSLDEFFEEEISTNNEPILSSSVRISLIEIEGDYHIASGITEITLPDGNIRKYKFVNKFLYINDSWKLFETQLFDN